MSFLKVCFPFLNSGCNWFCGGQSLCWTLRVLLFALWLSHCCWGQGLLPSFGVDTLRSVSKLQCEIGGARVLLLGEEPLSTPPQKLSIRKCTLVSPVTCCVGSQSTMILTLPLTPPQLWEFRQLAQVSLGHCAHKVSSANLVAQNGWGQNLGHPLVMCLGLPWEPLHQPRPFPPVSVLLIAKGGRHYCWTCPSNRLTCKTLPQALSLQSCSCWNTQISALLPMCSPWGVAQISALPLNVGKEVELCLCEHAVHEAAVAGVPTPPFLNDEV